MDSSTIVPIYGSRSNFFFFFLGFCIPLRYSRAYVWEHSWRRGSAFPLRPADLSWIRPTGGHPGAKTARKTTPNPNQKTKTKPPKPGPPKTKMGGDDRLFPSKNLDQPFIPAALILKEKVPKKNKSIDYLFFKT